MYEGKATRGRREVQESRSRNFSERVWTCHVREQEPGETQISTREGITPLLSDDLIMQGVEGEEYPIGRALFERTYRLVECN